MAVAWGTWLPMMGRLPDDLLRDRRSLDAVKGVLIVAVVLGHSLFADPLSPGLRTVVYSFHVQCFLLFSFLFLPGALKVRTIGDIAVRYLVPYAFAVISLSVLHAMTQQISFGTWMLDVSKALITGNARDLKDATGFYLYWFLPVLCVVVVLKTVYFHCPGRIRLILVICAVVGHLFLPAIPPSVKQNWRLFGTHIALFIFPLGLCVHYVATPLLTRLPKQWRFLLPCSLGVSLWLLLEQGWQVNLGNLAYASYRNLPALILQDSVAVLAFLSLLLFSGRLGRIPWLSQIGSQSLVIFLLHQAVIVATLRVLGGWVSQEASPGTRWLAAALSVLCGLLAPFFIGKLIYSRPRAKSILFPRSIGDWLYGLGFKMRPHALEIGGA